MNFKKINNISGWVVFAIASAVYLLTIEPTASFWDCGEFIASGYKLEVGHPCGAPLFMLMVRFFTMFAPSVELVPVFANAMSALASGLTIMFLFWTITHLAWKIVVAENAAISATQIILIIGSGVVGALAYTFSDTFWFSAVEGEVYATSSLFTALVFWAILKWEDCANEPYSNRWLILIAYLMGLSIGVHLLNLLAIPAIALVFYFKKYPYSFKGLCLTLLLSAAMLLLVMYGIIQGLVILASKFELLFVNGMGLPLMSGVIIFCAIIVCLLIWGLLATYRKRKVVLNTALLMLTVILIGYSSYTAIVVRSSANPPMDQNSPDNMFSLLYYLNREQYGDRPLVYGQSFSAQPIDGVVVSTQYAPKDGKYVEVRKKYKMKYESEFEMIFPRMFSGNDPKHIEAYKQWSNFKGKPVRTTGADGKATIVYTPTFGENLSFFFRYQLGFMYFRYFMWNFAGRQNDMQGHGDCMRGNWICGISAIDNARLGPQEALPDVFKNNKGRNCYYLLPLILGIAGMIYHIKKHKFDFWVVMTLFVLTGIAIVVYLNQTPYQPRERDYAYAGSFYAFSVWIGFGVLALHTLLKKIKDTPVTAAATTAVCLLVPAQMLAQNWDDHNRSHSYIPTDFGYNMLIGCKPNAIIFTYGDNDTFPLWYNQEVEGVRTDVRVANLNYLRGDWYIEQMQRKNYESDPLPLKTTFDKYYNSKRDMVLVYDRIKQPICLAQAIDFILSDDPNAEMRSPFEQNARINYFPSSKLYLNINKETIIRTQTVAPERMNRVVDTMHWALKKRMITKEGLVVYDLLATNKWERPIYYGTTVSSETFMNLDKFFDLEGMMYRIIPVETGKQWGLGSVNTQDMYVNLMEKYRFREIDNPKIYIDENKFRILSSYRNMFARLANALIDENQMDKAVAVLDRCMEKIPTSTVPLNYFSLSLVEGYYRAGKIEKAIELSDLLMKQASDILNYAIIEIKGNKNEQLTDDIQINMAILQDIWRMAGRYEKGEHQKVAKAEFDRFYSLLK